MTAILNSIALLTLIACGVGGLVLLRARLREARHDLGPICARCNAPADELIDFTCPACRHDVRELGLAVPQDRSPVSIFWRAIALTVATAFAAFVIYTWLAATWPPVRRFAWELEMTPAFAGRSSQVERFDVSATGRERGDVITGTIDVDMRLPKGVPLSLQIDERTRQATVRELNGRTVLQAPYGRDLLNRWLDATKIDTSDEMIIDAVAELDRDIEMLLAGKSDWNQAIIPGKPQSWTWGWNGGGVDATPDWLLPSFVMLVSSVWVAALRRYLNRVPIASSWHPTPPSEAIRS